MPDWSPDSTKIAFVLYGGSLPGSDNIYVMSVNGGTPIRLTDHFGNDTNPAWSPDGTQIAYQSIRDEYIEFIYDADHKIYVMNADGTNPRNLSNHPGDDMKPAWSPDGKHIAFISERMENAFIGAIYIMNADGSHQSLVAKHLVSRGHSLDWGEQQRNATRLQIVDYFENL